MAKKNEMNESIITVGVDDGFAATDVVVMDGGAITKTMMIQSRARSGIHGTSVIGEAEDDQPVPCYETDGVKFTVGALSDAESARFDDYPFSPMNRTIVNHALRLAGLGGKKLRIATGLPLSVYYQGSDPNAEVIARKDRSIMTPVACIDGSAMPLIVEHKVFPEGLSAWVDYALGDDGRLRADPNESVGVIDIGGRTTDVAVVLPGRRIDHARCGSADIGVLNVVEQVRVALLKRFNVEMSGSQIELGLKTRSIKMWGKVLDIGTEIDEAVAQVTDGVLREVSRRLGQAVDLDRVLLVGGGAHLFRDVEKRYPHVVVPEHPEYANARGFAKYLNL